MHTHTHRFLCKYSTKKFNKFNCSLSTTSLSTMSLSTMSLSG